MVTHDLKTLPVYFDAVERGEKTFEIRRDDRGFQKGDIIRLLRFEPEQRGYTTSAATRARGGIYNNAVTASAAEAACLERRILWILTGGQFGLESGYVILALGPVDPIALGQSPSVSEEGQTLGFSFLRSRLLKIAERRPPDVVIGGEASPYMRRWWVIPRNRWFKVYLHHFLRSDDDRALHDHPWWNASLLLLRGEYEEVVPVDPADPSGATRAVRREEGAFVFRRR